MLMNLYDAYLSQVLNGLGCGPTTKKWMGAYHQANVLTQLAALIARNGPANFPDKLQTDLGKILAEVN